MRQSRQEWAALQRADREARVLAAGIAAAHVVGFEWITRDDVATRAGCSPGSVNNAFGTMAQLKRAVLAEAVRLGDATIVAQGLAVGHEIARNAPPDLKERAASTLVA